MHFDRNEEQQLLAESLRRWLASNYGFEQRRAIVGSEVGASDTAWSTFAEMGLTALPMPAEAEGFGAGAADLIDVMEAFGEALVVEPYLSTLVAARLVERAGSDAQRAELLPRVASGEIKMALAHDEAGQRHGAARIATRATRGANGYTLDGAKRVVMHAPLADHVVVSARVSGEPGDADGIALFLVAKDATGVTADSYRSFDDQQAADLKFSGTPAQPLGDTPERAGAGFAALDEALDYGCALACAEAVGAIKYANEATLEYIKTRKQFGVPIGSFQVLQHRAVDMLIEWELARSMAMLACTRVDAAARGTVSDDERRRAVSAAKVRISEAARKVSQEAVQLHGGMGLAEELKISHTFRKLTALMLAWGDADHHLARFTRLS